MQRLSINSVITEHTSVNDRGFQYGDGLFETIKCVNGKLQFWDEHITRLNLGAKILGIEPPSGTIWLNDINNLLSNMSGRYVIKIVLTRGMSERGYKAPDTCRPTRVVMISDGADHSDSINRVSLCLCKHPISMNTRLSGIKHLNRLDNVLARNEWKDEFDEGLMSDSNSNIIEGTMSNVFGVRNAELYTPLLDDCGVDGIIRQQIIDIARESNIPLHVAELSKDDLLSMDEVFITNSIIGIWSVSFINDINFNLGDKTTMFYNELLKRVEVNAKVIF